MTEQEQDQEILRLSDLLKDAVTKLAQLTDITVQLIKEVRLINAEVEKLKQDRAV